MPDFNQIAARIVQRSIEGPPEVPEESSKQLDGRKGGKARAEKLSPKKRSEIARKAAQKRWDKPS